jgi:cytidylate kinase
MATITISRLLGSKGAAIAEKVSRKLSYPLVTKQTLEKILEQYGLDHLDSFYKAPPRLWSRLDHETKHLVSMLNAVMLGIAKHGETVILGRGGYAALNNLAGALHVRVQAPLQIRVRTIVEREGSDDIRLMEKLVKDNDRARAMFVNGFYDADFHRAEQFNLVIDTGLVPVDMAVEWIVAASKMADASPTAGTYLAKDIDEDPVLQETIDKVLAAE